MKYRVLLVDIDGTLMCPERKYLTQRSILLLNRLQKSGVLVIATTGRGFTAIRPQVLGGIVPDYSVCFNGACVLDKEGKILYGQPMSCEQMLGIAMGNAAEKVKAAADYITGDVKEDGVSQAIIKIFGLSEDVKGED